MLAVVAIVAVQLLAVALLFGTVLLERPDARPATVPVDRSRR